MRKGRSAQQAEELRLGLRSAPSDIMLTRPTASAGARPCLFVPGGQFASSNSMSACPCAVFRVRRRPERLVQIVDISSGCSIPTHSRIISGRTPAFSSSGSSSAGAWSTLDGQASDLTSPMFTSRLLNFRRGRRRTAGFEAAVHSEREEGTAPARQGTFPLGQNSGCRQSRIVQPMQSADRSRGTRRRAGHSLHAARTLRATVSIPCRAGRH